MVACVAFLPLSSAFDGVKFCSASIFCALLGGTAVAAAAAGEPDDSAGAASSDKSAGASKAASVFVFSAILRTADMETTCSEEGGRAERGVDDAPKAGSQQRIFVGELVLAAVIVAGSISGEAAGAAPLLSGVCPREEL